MCPIVKITGVPVGLNPLGAFPDMAEELCTQRRWKLRMESSRRPHGTELE